MTTKRKDHGWDKLKKNVSPKGYHVTVGIFGPKAAAQHKGGKATVLDVAIFNEFGTSRIPPRSFIHRTIALNQRKYDDLKKRLSEDIVLGRSTIKKALDLLGLQIVGDIKQRVADGIGPANAESTIRRKKSSKPLIDTGQLRGAITHKVEA